MLWVQQAFRNRALELLGQPSRIGYCWDCRCFEVEFTFTRGMDCRLHKYRGFMAVHEGCMNIQLISLKLNLLQWVAD